MLENVEAQDHIEAGVRELDTVGRTRDAEVRGYPLCPSSLRRTTYGGKIEIDAADAARTETRDHQCQAACATAKVEHVLARDRVPIEMSDKGSFERVLPPRVVRLRSIRIPAFPAEFDEGLHEVWQSEIAPQP